MSRERIDRMLEQAVASEDPSEAAALLEQAHAIDPEDADVLYELALVREELGDREGMIAAFLEVRRLDPRADRAAGLLDDRERERIAVIAENALESLPEPFRERLGNVAVVIEDYPPRHAVEQGFDPRAFGMFEGPDDLGQHLSTEIITMPTRIVLFWANLLAEFAPDEIEEQVTVTVLHEVGHYFGLDEDDVAALGLA